METIEQVVDYIMISFSGIYGPRFTSYIETSECNEHAFRHEWTLAIQGLTLVEAKHGVEVFRLKNNPWPPTPGQFVHVALEIPSASIIANGGGGEFGEYIRSKIADSYTMQRMSVYEKNQAINDVYQEERDRYIEQHLAERVQNLPTALGFQHVNEDLISEE